MYDEIIQASKSVEVIKRQGSPIIVIQSDPKDEDKILDKTQVDYYEMLPDLAGSKAQYIKERANVSEESSTTPVRAVTRNLSTAFTIAKGFDVDWWVSILGDVTISNLVGINNIIHKMIKSGKHIGITRPVGQVFLDNHNKPTRIQRNDTTDFMSQFFIVKSDLVKNGLFNNIKITNPYTGEQCVGDEVNRYCDEKGIKFSDLCYFISDYAYPKFIDGVQYNPDRTKLPRYIDGIVNALRKFRHRI